MRKLVSFEKKSKRKSLSRFVLICSAIAATVPLSGCKTTEGTLAQICNENGWREIGVRKGDVITDDTAREIIGNNESRAVWCAAGKKA